MPTNYTNGTGAGAENGKRKQRILGKQIREPEKAHGSRAKAVNGNGKGRVIDVEESAEGVDVDEGVIEEKRTALLTAKHAQLEDVFDRHDTLVREMFHLEEFVTMVAFDPKGAKAEDSAVFREYKSKYDLLEKATPDAGPSRKTRSAHTERKQLLVGPSISAPPLITPVRRKPKVNNSAAISNILSSAQKKGKGKERGGERNELTERVGVDESISLRKGKEREGTTRKRRRDEDNLPTENGHAIEPVEDSISVGPRRRSVRYEKDLGLKESVVTISAPPLHPSPIRATPASMRRSARRPTETVHVPSPSFNIKRIKLVVRRPPPPLTNPRQRPPATKYNASLTDYLSSYTSLNGNDVDESTLERRAIKQAALLQRIKDFKNQGRFVPDADVLFTSDPGILLSSTTPQRASRDVWDDVVETVVALGKRNKKHMGKQIASQIAAKVQAYWDGFAAKKDKAKVQEERRLRALAKATIKMVTNEWKKAVFHIREQERLKLEAEELKRGHEHLDAILDQSGQLLETQQGDLSRGDISLSRSRSTSVSETFGNWLFDEDEEDEGRAIDGQEEEDEELDIHQDGSEDEEDVDDEDGADLLLGDDRGGIRTPASATSSLMETQEMDTPFQESLHLSPSVDDDSHPQRDESLIPDTENHVHADTEILSPQETGLPFPLLNLTDYAMGDSERSSTEPSIAGDYDMSEDREASSTHSPNATTETASPPLFDPPLNNFDSQNITVAVPSSTPDPDSDIIVRTEMATSSEVLVGEADASPMSHPPSIFSIENLDPQLAALSTSGTEAISEVQEPSTILPSCDADNTLVLSSKSPLDLVTNHIDDQDVVLMDETQQSSAQALREELEEDLESLIPDYLKPYAVAPVDWDPSNKVTPPLLLRGVLRPYQQSGLEWLASLHVNNLNGILADEMGLGKTIQTISLLAHLACDRGIWGPHLIVVPTSVLLNWEMEFKKFLPGFKVLSYHGSTKRRKELRQGWNDKQHFNVCITSYTLASRDAHIFKRKPWYYMILDEAHMIKNFKSQRWNILLMFRSFRRLLLTGTPLQNNLTELWALLQFLMSGANFANLKEFGEWFSNPLEKAIEMGNVLDDETMQRVSKLHTVLRPYLLRRLKRDVEKELPSKYEHLVLCPLSKRQRFLYDEFMSRAHTRDALESGVYQKIANILMQLRKVCNHPDLFEVRPIVTSFAMQRSAIADFEIKELLLRRRILESDTERVNLDLLGLQFIEHQNVSLNAALETRRLEATAFLPFISEIPGEPPPKDTRTIAGFRLYSSFIQRANTIARWTHLGYLNRLRCSAKPIYSCETIAVAQLFYEPILPLSALDSGPNYLDTVQRVNSTVKSYAARTQEMSSLIDRFAFVTPPVVALDIPHIALSGAETAIAEQGPVFDEILHRASVKLQIAFPDPSLLQYDCGKLQELTSLLREKKAGGHRILIFTQMTKILDILEIFLNFHGYLYLRLDGATKIEDRQYITERFNVDQRVFCFIASSRSGGVGINLTGADTVVFYDSDFNPQMDKQCEDRAHRIGQIRDVHIYRFVSQHTVEEAMLRKANQKRSLDDLVIQKGEFDWRTLFNDEGALNKALGEFEDTEDAHAAAVATREEIVMEGADEADFGDVDLEVGGGIRESVNTGIDEVAQEDVEVVGQEEHQHDDEDEEEGGTTTDYMLAMVQRDYDFFKDWRL